MRELANIVKVDWIKNLSFTFSLFDIDGDKFLTGTDILKVKSNIQDDCPLSKEFKTIVNCFLEKHTMIKNDTNKNSSMEVNGTQAFIDFNSFTNIMESNNLLVQEMRDKLLGI